MSDITLSTAEIERMTGYKRPADQLEELKRQGFYRARRSPAGGQIILERAHYAAVKSKPTKIAVDLSAYKSEAEMLASRRTYVGSQLEQLHKVKRLGTEIRELSRKKYLEEDAIQNAANLALCKSESEQDHKAVILFHANKRRAKKLLRTPSWVDYDAIRAIYAEAFRISGETGIKHQVDHVLPLQGRLVSGLHVHTNMQILTRAANIRKSNLYEIEV